MDILEQNRKGWSKQVKQECPWTKPVDSESIQNAKKGNWKIILTPTKPIPKDWYPPLQGCKTLCLASGGGQQGPILAAAGAHVTVFDNCPDQLAQDRFVADREQLELRLVQGDMRDLHMFKDESFDLVINPVSHVFIPDTRPVWKEAYRVLKPGGSLLAGFTNPITYLFDDSPDNDVLIARNKLPYSDLKALSPEELSEYQRNDSLLEFSQTTEEHLQGQIDAGFMITGFYEDRYSNPEDECMGLDELLSYYMNPFYATRAWKPT